MEHIYDVLTIGGGPAGYTAAMYATRGGLDVAVLEKMSAGGQMNLTGDMENIPGFDEGIDGFTLGMKMQHAAEKFGAVTLYGEATALRTERDVKCVVTTNGEYRARTVILAGGAEPRHLGISDEEKLVGRGLHYCAHCDGRFYKGKTVAVVGGGNSAVGDALYLSRLAAKVILIHRRDTLRASKAEQEKLFAMENITVLWSTQVTSALTEDGRIAGLCCRCGGQESTVTCDGVFVSIGRVPVTDYLRGTVALDSSGYIVADETCRTELPGVFAAGDIRTKALRQVVTAAADGAVAAHFAEEYLNQYGR